MSAKYHTGRNDALRALGLTPTQQDNPLVEKFVQALPDDSGKDATKRQGNRPLHRQSWGKAFHYTTSDQDVRGGGVRL